MFGICCVNPMGFEFGSPQNEAIHYEGRSRTNLLELQCYNMKDGCQLATSGKPAKCSRGLHLCACCHKAGHSLVVCRDAKKV